MMTLAGSSLFLLVKVEYSDGFWQVNSVQIL